MTYPVRPATTSSLSNTSASHSMTSSGATSATAAVSNSRTLSAQRTEQLYLGIVFGSIAGLALIVALVAWCFNIRSKAKQRTEENSDQWPWDRDDRLVEEGYHSSNVNNSELGHGHPDDWGLPKVPGGRGSEMKTIDLLESLPQPPVLRYPPPGAVRGRDYNWNGMGTLSTPIPPSMSYPTVLVHNANQSVPDLAPDLGRLQVANYVPGDTSSCDGASRAESTQGTLSNIGSPIPNTPRSRHNGLGQGENMAPGSPWAPLRVGNSSLTRLRNYGGKGPALSPTFGAAERIRPGDPPSSTPSGSSSQEGWASSIRSNIVSAFHAVVGGTNSTPEGDYLTRAPLRTARRLEENQSKPLSEIFPRGVSNSSGDSVSPEVRTTKKVDGSSLTSRLKISEESLASSEDDDAMKYLPVMTKSGVVHELSVIPPAMASRSSSVYSEESAARSDRTSSTPPQLPQIPPMSRSSTSTSSWGDYDLQRKGLKQSRISRSRARKKSSRKIRRPTLKSRMSSTSAYSGIMSAGSDMSRTGSASSSSGGPLDDQELLAKMALRERRKRLMMSSRERQRPGYSGRSLKRRGTKLGSVHVRARVGEVESVA